jgi:hypothetical protein
MTEAGGGPDENAAIPDIAAQGSASEAKPNVLPTWPKRQGATKPDHSGGLLAAKTGSAREQPGKDRLIQSRPQARHPAADARIGFRPIAVVKSKSPSRNLGPVQNRPLQNVRWED